MGVKPVLETKRRVIGQMIVCQGCCCGATHKDRPEVPAEWLRDEWRKRGLLKRVQLIDQRLRRPMRCPECRCGEFRDRLAMAGQYHRIQPIQITGRMGSAVHGCWASSRTADGIQRAHDPALEVTGFDTGVVRSICLCLPLQGLELRTYRCYCSSFWVIAFSAVPEDAVTFIIYPVNRFHHTYIRLANV